MATIWSTVEVWYLGLNVRFCPAFQTLNPNRRTSVVGRKCPISILSVYVCIQYIPEVAPGTTNVLFGTLLRPLVMANIRLC